MTEETLAELKDCFLEAYDDNKDGKIDIREVRHKVVNRNTNGQKCSACSVAPNGGKLFAALQV